MVGEHVDWISIDYFRFNFIMLKIAPFKNLLGEKHFRYLFIKVKTGLLETIVISNSHLVTNRIELAGLFITKYSKLYILNISNLLISSIFNWPVFIIHSNSTELQKDSFIQVYKYLVSYYTLSFTYSHKCNLGYILKRTIIS